LKGNQLTFAVNKCSYVETIGHQTHPSKAIVKVWAQISAISLHHAHAATLLLSSHNMQDVSTHDNITYKY